MNLSENDLNSKDARETYIFNFSEQELREIQSNQIALMLKQPIQVTCLLVVVLLNLVFIKASDILLGILLGVFLVFVTTYIAKYSIYKKTWENSRAKVVESTYKYELFDEYFEINILRSEQTIVKQKVKFDEIEKIQKLINHYLLQIGGQIFIVRKSDLKEYSILYSYLYNHPMKVIDSTIPNMWQIMGVVLFVLSLCSILVGLVLVNFLSVINGMFTENMWLFFVVTPIPISSVVYGIVAKHKGYKYKKNIVAGIIMTVLLCVYGSFVFIF